MTGFITFASILSVRIGKDDGNTDVIIGPHASAEVFPDLESFESSILSSESFDKIAKYSNGKEGWRSWILLLEMNSQVLNARLCLSPFKVTVRDDRVLRMAESAFAKKATVILKTNNDEDEEAFVLTEIEMLRER